MGTGSPAFSDILAHVAAVGIDHLLASCLLDGHLHRVGACSLHHGTGTPLVKGTAVIVSDRDNHPVAWFQGLTDGRPELGVEGTGAHAAQCLVLHADAVGVEILMGEVTPSPLSVVAVAQCTIAHGGVADEEEHGIIAASGGAWCGSCHECLIDAVRGVVHHLVLVFDWL